MKKLILLNFILFISLFAHAQLGVTGGLNMASLRNGSGLNRENTYKVGFQAGIFYDINLSEKVTLRPQLLLLNESYKRFSPGDSDYGDPYYEESSKSFSCLLPVIFSYKIPTKSRQAVLIDLGMFTSIGLFGDFDANYQPVGGDDKLYPKNRELIDFGLIGGLCYDTQLLTYGIHLKYGARDITYYNDKSITFLFSVRYKLR